LDGRLACRVSWGKAYPEPFVETTGDSARVVAPVIRENFAHKVARVDTAFDVVDDVSFDEITRRALAVAERSGLTTEVAGDWMQAERGRTLYIGSRHSQSRLCIYEKGREQGIDAEWTRIELRTRPHSRNKSAFSTATESEIFRGYAPAIEIVEACGLEVPAGNGLTNTAARHKSDVERSRRALARQYFSVIDAWVREAGSPDEFLAELAGLHYGLKDEAEILSERGPGDTDLILERFLRSSSSIEQ
jgi:hypothetical protein